MYALKRKILEAFLVVLNQFVTVGSTVFYAFRHRQTFHYRPPHAIAFDVFPEVAYFLARPNFPVRHIMQCSNDAFNSNLTQHLERNLIVFAEPSPYSVVILNSPIKVSDL